MHLIPKITLEGVWERRLFVLIHIFESMYLSTLLNLKTGENLKYKNFNSMSLAQQNSKQKIRTTVVIENKVDKIKLFFSERMVIL